MQSVKWVSAPTLYSFVSFVEVMWISGVVHEAPGTEMQSKKRKQEDD